MKKIISLLLALAMMLALASCAGGTASPSAEESEASGAQIPNPFTDCGDDFQQAAEVSGFEFKLPFFSNYTISAMEGMTTVTVPINTDSDEARHYRKSTETGDISGVYDDALVFSVSQEQAFEGYEVNFGVKEELIYVIYWTMDGFGYSISDDVGLTNEQAVSIVTEVLGAQTAE